MKASNSDKIIIRAFFTASKEQMFDVGQRNGLHGEALELFKYFNTIEVLLTVERNTGDVLTWEIAR